MKVKSTSMRLYTLIVLSTRPANGTFAEYDLNITDGPLEANRDHDHVLKIIVISPILFAVWQHNGRRR